MMFLRSITSTISRLSLGLLALLLLLALLIASEGGAHTALNAKRTAAITGLHIQGNQLRDASNNPVKFVGVNRSGSEYSCSQGAGMFDGPSDLASVQAMASWHVNAVRVPLNEACWLGINGVPAAYAGANYQTAIVNYVNLLHANGMYAELSLLATAPGTQPPALDPQMPDLDHSPAFWTSIANTFKNDPLVIFGLLNEPHNVGWPCWRDGGASCSLGFTVVGFQQLVTTVRNTGATQPISIGCLDYSNNCSDANGSWLTYKPTDPLNSLIAEAHIYGKNACASASCFNQTMAPINSVVPMLFAEVGETYDGTDCNNSSTNVSTFMTWADSHGIGYLAWTWDTWGACSLALITDYAGTPYGVYGNYVKSHFLAVTGTTMPAVVSVIPNIGPAAGGTPVTITGTNFTGATAVKFGNANATFTVTDATHIAATSPAGSGIVDVTVTTPNGTSSFGLLDKFMYSQSCLAGSVPSLPGAVSTTQYQLSSSDGTTWQEIDPASLRLVCAPTANQPILLTGNADLWTSNAGYNQDLGIFVSDNGGADQLLAWKESGGFAGTYSPNAAYVQYLFNMTFGHVYVFKLMWKTNKPAPGATIYAGAGSGTYSPISLLGEAFPATSTPTFAAATTQYKLMNSNGVLWQTIDANNLSTVLSPSVNSTAVLGANADLWTANPGYNQDFGIFVSDNGGPDQLVAWKESGGFAGTYSPNAAFVKATYPMTGGHSYVFKLKWKTNVNAAGATIYAAAGSGLGYSPTTLFAQTLAGNPNTAVSTGQYSLASSDGSTWQPIDAANLTTIFTASNNGTALVGANADLWTANAGFNQDIGIFVSDNGGADQLVAWKESGGFAGTYSPNAAFVQGTYPTTSGHTYVFKLKWKTNKPAFGASIFSAAGTSTPYSPTRLTVEIAS